MTGFTRGSQEAFLKVRGIEQVAVSRASNCSLAECKLYPLPVMPRAPPETLSGLITVVLQGYFRPSPGPLSSSIYLVALILVATTCSPGTLLKGTERP